MSHKRSPTSEADAEAAKARKHPHSSHHEEPDAEPSPVPIAPSKIPPSDKQTWVVCLDGSVGADRALAWTVRAMHTHHDKLVLLTVTELVESSALSQFEEFLHAQIKFNEELEKHSAKLLQEAESKCRHAHVHDVTTVTLRGDPKYEIEEWVKGAVVDNVVLSRRGTGDRESSDVGGVSDYLVAKLPTNVIVVK